jgi:hypothetical protein
MPDVTIIIPVGPGHKTLAERAAASVRAQTVKVEALAIFDREGRGPGHARNRGLARVTTPYVVFLDADDWIAPTFVERALRAMQPNRYVYTDWYEGETVKTAPEKPWCGGTWHVITALIPTEMARAVGGFDETLPGAEDTDFYLKLTTRKWCGIRLGEPLFHYGAEGTRAKTFKASPDEQRVMKMISERYGGKMGCCGVGTSEDLPPAGEKQDGDVLARAMWGGNRREMGRVTGRIYPRVGNNATAWVDPRDIQAAPTLWQEVVSIETPVDAPFVLDGLDAVARAILPNARWEPNPEPVKVTPDVSRVIDMAKGRIA